MIYLHLNRLCFEIAQIRKFATKSDRKLVKIDSQSENCYPRKYVIISYYNNLTGNCELSYN